MAAGVSNSFDQAPAGREQAGVQRLFFALWPPRELAEELAARTRRWLEKDRGRPVAPGNIHFTLAFLGATSEDQRACYEQAADGIAGKRSELVLDQVGHWRRSGILWAGCAQEPAALLALATGLNAALHDGCGYEPDSRPFRVHVTLARHVRRFPGAAAGGRAAAESGRGHGDSMPPLRWPVSEFVLVASDTRPDGARYGILRRWPLA